MFAGILTGCSIFFISLPRKFEKVFAIKVEGAIISSFHLQKEPPVADSRPVQNETPSSSG
jgi:hypothetical protein